MRDAASVALGVACSASLRVAPVDAGGPWSVDVPCESFAPAAEAWRIRELERPLGASAACERSVLLRYADGVVEQVVVTRGEQVSSEGCRLPSWARGAVRRGRGHAVLGPRARGSDEVWWAAFILVLWRFRGDVPAATTVGEHLAWTSTLRDRGEPWLDADTCVWFGGSERELPFQSPPRPFTVLWHGSAVSYWFDRDELDLEVAERFADAVDRARDQLVASSADVRVARIDLGGDAFVETPGLDVADTGLAAEVLRVAAEWPDAIAVTDADTAISYAELAKRSETMAEELRSSVSPGSLVAVSLEPSVELVVVLLAILRAGCAYVPIDVRAPRARVEWVCADAGVATLVTDGADLDGVPTAAPRQLAPGLAYVIYTSGSTGRPKGVRVPQRNVVALLAATRDRLGLGTDDVWTFFHSLAFDFSVWEIWGCLLTGGRLVVVPYWVSRSPDEHLALLARENVTVLSQTPTAFGQLLDAEAGSGFARPRLVLLGGEAFDTSLLRRWYASHPASHSRVVNLYGITETTVHVTMKDLGPADADSPVGLVGRPLAGWWVAVRDPSGNPLPYGAIGQLYIGGAGLADGYTDPALTVEAFVVDRVRGERAYASGDLGRILPDGQVEYLGRRDDQVKVHGHRIELAEVRRAVLDQPGVEDCVVLVDRAADGVARGLEAFVVLGAGTDQSTIARGVRSAVPEHLVPSRFQAVDALPSTVNGKLDVVRLRKVARPLVLATPVLAVAEDALERRVGDLWDELLGGPAGLDDDLFEIGATSVVAARICARLRADGFELSVRDVFACSTIRRLAARLRSKEKR
ncbi:non-ribosomal peptide synthetase [Tenggerimyces flavus]|uniref:Non-ribosomal peptide synthetase n=1 Tax=Tenggerimyces flavus TaxID=1708749 RepID=A0ABV7YLY3_9ACTN|nr:non-ribosomal peptide synthetase [Tenggerimyces flavus]